MKEVHEDDYTDEDLAWIQGAPDDDTKEFRKSIINMAIDVNGYSFQAGVAKSFIPHLNYYQMVEIEGIPDHVLQTVELALNWNALGQDLGALAGAAIRWGLRDKFDPKRETVVHEEMTQDIMEIVEKYLQANQNEGETIAYWSKQCYNVLGLAGAIFNRELHHWNANNTKPQKALLGALNQADKFTDRHYRAMFYLSIHPIPLVTLEQTRQAIVEGKISGITDAVTVRCKSAPAGCGDIAACASVIPSLKAETFVSKIGTKFMDRIDELEGLNKNILNSAGSYHPFASSYETERILVDKNIYKPAMVLLAAYIKAIVKGTLGESNALEKFIDTNARQVRLFVNAFKEEAESAGTTLAELAKD
jgi:hypothetical protein